MRVARWYSNRDVRVEEMPVPQIGSGEVLMRIEASGICGSDVMEWYRLHRAPLVLGHEIAGRIEAVGSGVTQYQVGDRIAVAHHVPCDTCHYCLSGHQTACDTLHTTNIDPGGLAEYARLPEINVDRGIFRIPDTVSYETATFTEPLACVLRGLRRLDLQAGNTLVVIGSGIAGLLYIQMARAFGAGCIVAVDIDPARLKHAVTFGADHAVDAGTDLPSLLRGINQGRLADRVILCTGALPAIDQALKSTERGGTVLFFAPTDPETTFPLAVNDVFWRRDVTLTTSYAGSPADYQAALDMIQAGTIDLNLMITHRLGLSEVARGFQLVARGGDSIKVIVTPHQP
jgi:L-iditol 2-dehydrogenase